MSKFKVGDNVRILNGSEIENYTGAWSVANMGNLIGEIHAVESVDDDWWGDRVSYKLKGSHFTWDERGLELVENKHTETQTTKKLITREEFVAAMHATAEDITKDPKCEGMAKLVIPLTGMTFARQMEEILFGRKE